MPNIGGVAATGVFKQKHSSWSYTRNGGARFEMYGNTINTAANSIVFSEFYGHIRTHGSWAYSAVGFDKDFVTKGWEPNLKFGQCFRAADQDACPGSHPYICKVWREG